jgi:hypothetical protein
MRLGRLSDRFLDRSPEGLFPVAGGHSFTTKLISLPRRITGGFLHGGQQVACDGEASRVGISSTITDEKIEKQDRGEHEWVVDFRPSSTRTEPSATQKDGVNAGEQASAIDEYGDLRVREHFDRLAAKDNLSFTIQIAGCDMRNLLRSSLKTAILDQNG